MKRLPGVREFGPQGPADVEFHGDTFTVTFLDSRGNPTEQSFVFKKSDLPEGSDPPDGTYSCSVSADGQYLQGFRPLNGPFDVKVTRFTARPNEPPKPKHDTGTGRKKDGSTYPKDELTFGVLAAIQDDPDYHDLEVYLKFIYQRRGNGFCPDEEGLLAIRGDGETQQRLDDFMNVTGASKRPIPYSDNVLPDLEKVILQLNKPFMVVLRDGWAISYGPPMSLRQARKAAPKAKTKKAAPKKKK